MHVGEWLLISRNWLRPLMTSFQTSAVLYLIRPSSTKHFLCMEKYDETLLGNS